MPLEHTVAGHRGEDIASWYLKGRGCVIVSRNVRVWPDEIDLIMTDGPTMVAVEVKYSTGAVDPLDSVDDAKLHRFARAVGGTGRPIARMDLVGISRRSDGVVVRWLRGVY
jgi:Holliday junction resolvase-like predicted endonuclease